MIEYYHTGPIPPLSEVAVPLISPVMVGPPDIIPGLLPRAGTLVVAGETNCGKSLLALETVSALTTTGLLWGELKPEKQLKKVLYILGEHHLETIQLLWRHTKLPMSEEVMLLGPEKIGYNRWLVISGKPNTVAIDKFKRWAEGMDLLVWDPLSAFVCGDGAENDNIGMRVLLDTISMISQSAGAACMVLAHQGKPMMDTFGKEVRRQTYAIRGASGLEDSATHIFYMGRASNQTIETETGGQVFELVNRKYKGIAPPKHTLLRNKETLTHTLIGDKPFEAVRKMDLRAKMFRIQEANPQMNQDTILGLIANMEGKSKDTIRRWLGLQIG